MPVITSKYSGRCSSCGNPHSVGEPVYWVRGIRGVKCMNCHNGRKDEETQTQNGSVKPKKEIRKVDIPGAVKHANERYFTIDWADFKEIMRDAVFNNHTPLNKATNADYILAHTQGNTWAGFSRGQLERWLTEGFQTEAIRGLGDFIPPIREKRRLEFVEEGDEFHIDLAWNGADNFMSQWTKREVIPGVALECGIMFSASTDAKVVNAYNAWICKALYSLETSGVDCQVTLDFPSWNLFRSSNSRGRTSAGSGELVHNIIRVKKENEVSDFLSWSAMLSPASLRCFGFSLGAIHADSAGEVVSSSFGRGTPERYAWKVVYDSDRRVIVVENCYSASHFPEENMTRQLREVLKQLNNAN